MGDSNSLLFEARKGSDRRGVDGGSGDDGKSTFFWNLQLHLEHTLSAIMACTARGFKSQGCDAVRRGVTTTPPFLGNREQ